MAQQNDPEKGWLWNAADEDGYVYDQDICEARFDACGVYSRALVRYKLVAAGRDPTQNIDQPNVNPGCFAFAAGLPFYGCFIGNLQHKVRQLYGIDGCDATDFYEGCCCPCTTLVRSEQEIILRAGGHGNASEKPYQSHSSMTTRGHTAGGHTTRGHATRGHARTHSREGSDDRRGHPTFPKKATTKGSNNVQSHPHRGGLHGSNSRGGGHTGVRLGGSQRADAGMSGRLDAGHSLEDHPTVGRTIPSNSHPLEDDATTPVHGQGKEHTPHPDPGYGSATAEAQKRSGGIAHRVKDSLEEGLHLSGKHHEDLQNLGRHGHHDDVPGSGKKHHLLHSDDATVTHPDGTKHKLDNRGLAYTTQRPATPHVLEDDMEVSLRGNANAGNHDLEADAVANARGEVRRR